MDLESLLAERERLIALGQQAKGGDEAAVDELLSYALQLLVEEYNRNLPKGRTEDKEKINATVGWAIKAARLQLEETGKITQRNLTTDTVLLADTHGVTLAARSAFNIIKKNLVKITRIAAFTARPVNDGFKESIEATLYETGKEIFDNLVKNINGRN